MGKANEDPSESEMIEKTEEMEQYEEETGKYAIWRGVITEGFKKWKEGEKIYDRDKERISLYISEDTKKKWQEFKEHQNYSTISKLIRKSVNTFIDKEKKEGRDEGLYRDVKTFADISHALKEPLTTIKGFSQLLLENKAQELSDEVILTLENIVEQSNLLESRIINILDDIKSETMEYDVLLIEDDQPTIRLITSFFESKGYVCKGIISGKKGLEELQNSNPKVILLDIILPDINGYDLCRKIKENGESKDIPVYYLTAIPESEVEKNLEETMADGYILKPFDFSDFDVIFEKLENAGN